MKKLRIFVCLSLVLILCLCGCGSKWIITTQYVTEIVNQFMNTDDYKKMVADFENAFADPNLKLIVRRPYVEAAIELRMDEPACHYLILQVRGDFGKSNSSTDVLKIVYDIDSGIFYDSLIGHGEEFEARYPGMSGSAIESLLHRPKEIYTTALGSEPLQSPYEEYHALNADELAVVNQALGVEKPSEGILYEALPPAEPESWVLNTQYAADAVTNFMATAEYAKMIAFFKTTYHSDHAKLIVRQPYVDAAIEFYLEEENSHLLILALRGDFGYDNQLTVIYDLNSGTFYDRISASDPEQTEKYAAVSDKLQVMMLDMPREEFTNLTDNAVLWTEYASHRQLNAEELTAVNQLLGTEEPSGDILFEPLPTEIPVDVPGAAPADTPIVEAPSKQATEPSISAQYLADTALRFYSDPHYTDIADDLMSKQILAAFEYTLSDFEGHNVHLLVVRVDGVNTDMWGFSADTFLVDIESGNLYYDSNLDLNNWADMSTLEDAFACVICTPVWETRHIYSDMEIRIDLSQNMIDAANAALSN